ncbi:cyanophycinase [Rufibacter sp. XAAS-G3-1]|uniref:cyanophycinase n=1 Tax=Rufibacter sp. XAAS-G3-1 TaxID=2729134 RepID=UPI0015E68FBF|nr:cyanophycinase [Rufibacter sp. XAAS-G3-1]
MKYIFWLSFSLSALGLWGCKATPLPQPTPLPPTPSSTVRPASLGIVGDSTDVKTPVTGGLVLMGGGKDVESAFKWMIQRSGGGNVVVIRVTGTNAYNPFIAGLGTVKSVETLKIDTRDLANNDTVARIIRNAEMLFIAGGDQSKYMNLWRGTKTQEAINYLLQTKKAPVGGTSAGCAIMGGFYYSGESGSSISTTALADPYHSTITLYNNDFVQAPFLRNIITDQHYLARTREGRHVAFLARIKKDWNVAAQGIAADERTAVCIDQQGMAQAFGSSKAYFLLPNDAKAPELVEKGKPLLWKRNEQALAVYEITASDTGSGQFNVDTFHPSSAAGGKWYWWWVENGQLHKKDQ